MRIRTIKAGMQGRDAFALQNGNLARTPRPLDTTRSRRSQMNPFQMLHRVGRRMAALSPVHATRVCCICSRRVQRFLPYREGWAGMPAVVTEADMVGSDVEHFECPACGCHDRERHLYLYLNALGHFDAMRGARVLHFAPEIQLQRMIAAAMPVEYVRADLAPVQSGVRQLDITAIDQPSERFDVVIANHVLEHVGDDGQALREILRVLRPGGHAILQTPFAAGRREKFEDPDIRSDIERLQAYGQEDHCRLYGADFVEYVVSFGFISRVAQHAVLLPDVDPGVSGVNPREPLLLFAKPDFSA